MFTTTRQAQRLAGGRKHRQMIAAMEAETADALWYLYADARPFLDRLAPYADLHLLSLGHRPVQHAKLDATGLAPYFSSVTIVEEPKAETRLPFPTVEHAIFVNDNAREMVEIAGVYRWATHLHVSRSGDVPAGLPFESHPNLESVGARILDLIAVKQAA